MFAGFNLAFLPMHLTGLLGMPRRVYTYPSGLGWDGLNMASTLGAFVFTAGFLIVVLDVVRPRKHQPYAKPNPWNGGTLEWLIEMPPEDWGVRSVPLIESRYPLWDQPNFADDVAQGRFYLPHAEEMKRETLVTSVLDAEPIQCLRVPGPTWLTFWAAAFTGGFFIFATYHWWTVTILSGLVALAVTLRWLWTGTVLVPEKSEKNVGLGLTLPLYQSGPKSVGWWAMFITMNLAPRHGTGAGVVPRGRPPPLGCRTRRRAERRQARRRRHVGPPPHLNAYDGSRGSAQLEPAPALQRPLPRLAPLSTPGRRPAPRRCPDARPRRHRLPRRRPLPRLPPAAPADTGPGMRWFGLTRSGLKRFALHAAVTLALVGAAGLMLAVSGLVSVAASSGHWDLTG